MPPLHLLQPDTAQPETRDAGELVEYALALLDIGGRQWTRALARLDRLRDSSLAVVSLPDRIEAYVRLGRRTEAVTALELFVSRIGDSHSTWLAARRACAGALLASGDAAAVSYEHALRLVDGSFPFDGARIRLLYGEHLRRARRRADARVELRAALSYFESAHAGPWVERAQAELQASGETARRRDPSTIDQLTPHQLRIAHLVADGLSNKEVAQRFYLSPRTVDNHLRSIFSKLGLTSRAQLAALVAREAIPSDAAPRLAA